MPTFSVVVVVFLSPAIFLCVFFLSLETFALVIVVGEAQFLFGSVRQAGEGERGNMECQCSSNVCF